MDGAKEKTKVVEIAKTSLGRKGGGNTNKLLRSKRLIDSALTSLSDFPELHAELRGFREKLWNRFLELER